MKLYNLFNIILLCFIKSIIAFSQSQLPAGSIIVAKDGSGNFNTVQAAVDSLPKSANSERVIFIKNGTYREQVSIQKDFVTLIGENKDKVIITYDLNNAKTGSSSECATVKAKCSNFKAFDITFENTAPFPGDNAQAPAFYSYGNQHYIENCNFLSYQDTLLSYHGTQYFKNCFIQGLTDFIWGFGRAVFDNCTLNVVSKGGKTQGYLTANGNEDSNFKEGGFLITNSKVTSDGATFYLGRLWKKHCYVIFNKVTFPGDKIVKEGWLTFSGNDDYKFTSKVGEYQCQGNNYNTFGRVSWSTTYTSVPSIDDFLGFSVASISNSVYKSAANSAANNNTSNNNNPVNTVTIVRTTTTKVTPTNNNNNSNNNGQNFNNGFNFGNFNNGFNFGNFNNGFNFGNFGNFNNGFNFGQNNNPAPQNNAIPQNNVNKAVPQNNANAAATQNCNPLFYQCGGYNFKGSTCCKQGTCKKFNDMFSMCM